MTKLIPYKILVSIVNNGYVLKLVGQDNESDRLYAFESIKALTTWLEWHLEQQPLGEARAKIVFKLAGESLEQVFTQIRIWVEKNVLREATIQIRLSQPHFEGDKHRWLVTAEGLE